MQSHCVGHLQLVFAFIFHVASIFVCLHSVDDEYTSICLLFGGAFCGGGFFLGVRGGGLGLALTHKLLLLCYHWFCCWGGGGGGSCLNTQASVIPLQLVLILFSWGIGLNNNTQASVILLSLPLVLLGVGGGGLLEHTSVTLVRNGVFFWFWFLGGGIGFNTQACYPAGTAIS